MLRGKANYKSEGKCGDQAPGDAKITLAVPSRTMRDKSRSSFSQHKIAPGFIEEGILKLVETKSQVINLGFDEKSLAEGKRMIDDEHDEHGKVNFKASIYIYHSSHFNPP